jgi:hypothetical protein
MSGAFSARSRADAAEAPADHADLAAVSRVNFGKPLAQRLTHARNTADVSADPPTMGIVSKLGQIAAHRRH